MDLWVVAAAAGAGYVAKNLQNLSLDNNKKESLNLGASESRNFLQQLRDKTCPFSRLARNKHKPQGNDAAFWDSLDQLGNRVSESGLEEDYYMFQISSAEEESLEFGGFKRGKLVRNRKGIEDSIRPVDSLGSFLDAQLCRGLEKEDIMGSLVSSLSAVRFTGGSGMLSGSNCDSSLVRFEGRRDEVGKGNGACLEGYNARPGCTSLPQFESAEDVAKDRKMGSSSVGRSGSSEEAPLQEADRMLLFLVGMTVGILSATTASKNGVDQLNKQLKQTQNLVQDLHEELDMKDMLTVKELRDGRYLPPGASRDTPLSSHEPNASPSDEKAYYSPKFEKTTDNVELMSKIEAELEAELEMLEQNMKDSMLESVSNVVEMDPDFELDIVKGGLDPVMVSEVCGGFAESGNETTDTTPGYNYSQPPNHAVCPWELSLRLHELIEIRLQVQIKELEIALDNSRNSSQFQSSQSIALQNGSPYSGTSCSSSHQTPTCIYEHDGREDWLPAKTYSTNLHSAYKDQGMNQYKHTWPGFTSDEESGSEDDDTDESETLLLKQIIERTKSGPSLVLEFLRNSESGVME